MPRNIRTLLAPLPGRIPYQGFWGGPGPVIPGRCGVASLDSPPANLFRASGSKGEFQLDVRCKKPLCSVHELGHHETFFRVIAVMALLAIAALIGLASWRVATRPTAIGLSEKQLRSQITKEMPRRAVLELLGPPHSESKLDGWYYINSYLSREARHHSKTPSTFHIFFKKEKVDSVLSAYDF